MQPAIEVLEAFHKKLEDENWHNEDVQESVIWGVLLCIEKLKNAESDT